MVVVVAAVVVGTGFSTTVVQLESAPIKRSPLIVNNWVFMVLVVFDLRPNRLT